MVALLLARPWSRYAPPPAGGCVTPATVAFTNPRRVPIASVRPRLPDAGCMRRESGAVVGLGAAGRMGI